MVGGGFYCCAPGITKEQSRQTHSHKIGSAKTRTTHEEFIA
jgi:hypothetical protein